jgi:hypothetical protein
LSIIAAPLNTKTWRWKRDFWHQDGLSRSFFLIFSGDFWHLCFKQGGQKATSTGLRSFHQESLLNVLLTPILRGIIHHFGGSEWLWPLGESRDGTSSAKTHPNWIHVIRKRTKKRNKSTN